MTSETRFTVAELRKELASLPSDMPVVVESFREAGYWPACWAEKDTLRLTDTHLESCVELYNGECHADSIETEGVCESSCMPVDVLKIVYKHTIKKLGSK